MLYIFGSWVSRSLVISASGSLDLVDLHEIGWWTRLVVGDQSMVTTSNRQSALDISVTYACGTGVRIG